jgi:hypothetical protein
MKMIAVHLDEYDNQLFWRSKMTQFKKAKRSRLRRCPKCSEFGARRKVVAGPLASEGRYQVKFRGGALAVFDANNIRAVMS